MSRWRPSRPGHGTPVHRSPCGLRRCGGPSYPGGRTSPVGPWCDTPEMKNPTCSGTQGADTGATGGQTGSPVWIRYLPAKVIVIPMPAGFLACDAYRLHILPDRCSDQWLCNACHAQLRGSFRFDGIPFSGTTAEKNWGPNITVPAAIVKQRGNPLFWFSGLNKYFIPETGVDAVVRILHGDRSAASAAPRRRTRGRPAPERVGRHRSGAYPSSPSRRSP